ncbi:MAG: flagellar hook-length control protein FliK, partial [Gemmatimonadales bacterium]|nr:flagellar hook-length control protein FliK [Gemmatimonadales bacterium]
EAAPPVMTAPTGSKVEATLPENATQQKSNPEQTLPGGTTTHTADIDPALSSEASQLDKHAGSFAMESFSQPAGLGVQPPGSRVESVTIGSTTPTEASPSRSKNIQNQVAKHIATHASGTNGLQKMTLQLNPENLGKVEIQIQGSDDKLSVVITASGREAEQSLRDGVKELVGGIMERSGRWQQVDIRVEQKESDSRRQGRDSTERQDDQEKQGGHGHRGQREQERPEQAKSWAEFHQGV